MALTIWKFPLAVTERQTIEAPRGAQALHVRERGARSQPHVWMLCNPDEPLVRRGISMCGTGHQAPAGEYIGTAFEGEFVWHYFMDQNQLTERATQMTDIHPKPTEFTDAEVQTDHILRYFHYSHLPPALQARSKPFCDLARLIIDTTGRNPERSVALRKLLESKDAAVRAGL